MPFEAFRRVQRGQRDAVDGWRVLHRRPLFEVGHERGHGVVGALLGEPRESGERLPAFACRAAARHDRCEPGGREHGAHGFGERARIGLIGTSGSAQQKHGFTHFGPLEEPLSAAQHVRNTGFG